MRTSLKSHVAAYCAGALFALLVIAFVSFNITKASAPPGLPAAIYNASTTNQVISTTQGILAATSTNCAARIISTASSSLMLTFTDYQSQGVVPTGGVGIWQAASTTVAYDGGIYGCGAIRGLSENNVAGNVTVLDVR